MSTRRYCAAGSVCLRPATAADLPDIVAMSRRAQRSGAGRLPARADHTVQPQRLHGALGSHSREPAALLAAGGRRRPAHRLRPDLSNVAADPAAGSLPALGVPASRQAAARHRPPPVRRVDELGPPPGARVELQFIAGNELARQFWMKVGFRAFASNVSTISTARRSTEPPTAPERVPTRFGRIQRTSRHCRCRTCCGRHPPSGRSTGPRFGLFTW